MFLKKPQEPAQLPAAAYVLNKLSSLNDAVEEANRVLQEKQEKVDSIRRQIDAVLDTPPDRAEVKRILRECVAGCAQKWGGALADRLHKAGVNHDLRKEFADRLRPVIVSPESFVANDFHALLVAAALSTGIDYFVDHMLQWPDGASISEEDRARKIEALTLEYEPARAEQKQFYAEMNRIGAIKSAT